MSHLVTMFSAWGPGELATAAAIAVTLVLLNECIVGARIHDGSAVTIKCRPCTVTVQSNTESASVVVYHSVSPVSPSGGTPESGELNKPRAAKSPDKADKPDEEEPDKPGETEEPQEEQPGEPGETEEPKEEEPGEEEPGEEEPGEEEPGEEEPGEPESEAASDTRSEVLGDLESELDPVLVRFGCGDA